MWAVSAEAEDVREGSVSTVRVTSTDMTVEPAVVRRSTKAMTMSIFLPSRRLDVRRLVRSTDAPVLDLIVLAMCLQRESWRTMVKPPDAQASAWYACGKAS